MNLILISTIVLNHFNANIYKEENYSGTVVDTNYINTQLNILNNQETAIELAQILTNFDGVVQSDIFDKNNNLVFRISSII